jgi:hypothetical protein
MVRHVFNESTQIAVEGWNSKKPAQTSRWFA